MRITNDEPINATGAVDPRSLSTPDGVESPLVPKRSDAIWTRGDEAAFRESAFRVYYGETYAEERNAARRFALALLASIRPVLNPQLIPAKPMRRNTNMRAPKRDAVEHEASEDETEETCNA